MHRRDFIKTAGAILAKTEIAAVKGEYEIFKTTTNFDGTTHNSQWMG